ncbi:hypothetical protein [Rhodoferax sp.]|uniref:hypothetical protein n=1 Tax=Rhodoferax sp. TaxID=50421 RepID=UPI00283ACF7A|nr:hypothetical protein [Rhodoferax sp.]MDR3369281.1 hypothetical protein [Rhodoferax sp.]
MVENIGMNQLVNVLAKALALSAVLMLNGCAVITVADAAVSVAATVVKTGVNVAGAAINAALPD